MTLRALSHADITASAGLPDLIPVIAAAMRQVSERRVEMPLRFIVPLQSGAGFGVMTGAMAGVGHGAKLLTLMRREKGSSHTGALILFDAESGEPTAIVDSGLPTAMRTAAASAVATDALARKDAATLAILGAGEQAEWHIEAMRAVRPIRDIRVWGRSAENANMFAATHDSRAVASVDEACDGADIVCTVTSAATPILHAAQLPAGVHVNAVGASVPSQQEIAPDCHGVCRTVVDYRPSAATQAGELIAARAAGIVPSGMELPEIGEVLSGKAPGRASPQERTLYRSLGIIAQDLATVNFLLRRAEATGRGTVLDLYA
jgi:ornithine cyclodeaminase